MAVADGVCCAPCSTVRETWPPTATRRDGLRHPILPAPERALGATQIHLAEVYVFRSTI